jgi:hypothetical protein
MSQQCAPFIPSGHNIRAAAFLVDEIAAGTSPGLAAHFDGALGRPFHGAGELRPATIAAMRDVIDIVREHSRRDQPDRHSPAT